MIEDIQKKYHSHMKKVEKNNAKLTITSKQIVCPNCGTKLFGDAKFCTHCGNPVQKEKLSSISIGSLGSETSFNLENNSHRCSHCGSSSNIDTRYIACVAKSLRFLCENNTSREVTTNDDIRPWKIALCDKCLPSGYKEFLLGRKEKLKTPLFGFSVLLIIGILVFYFKLLPTGNLFMLPFEKFLSVAISIGFAVGIIGLPVYIGMWIVNANRLKNLEENGIVPENHIDNSFMGEGLRVGRVLSSKKNTSLEKVWGEFPLPEHKTLDEMGVSEADKKKLSNPICTKDVVAVGKTVEEMEREIPSEWKSVWEKRKSVLRVIKSN